MNIILKFGSDVNPAAAEIEANFVKTFILNPAHLRKISTKMPPLPDKMQPGRPWYAGRPGCHMACFRIFDRQQVAPPVTWSSASRIASSGVISRDTSGYFLCSFGSETTAKEVTSEPVPLVVGIAISPTSP